MLLDPPYDGHALWHEHFFAPDGQDWPMETGDPASDERAEYVGRYDAVEDRLGRIFVWSAERQEVMCVVSGRDDARFIARILATGVQH